MTKLLIVFLIFFPFHSFPQVADFITVSKNNGLTLKRFFTGSSIILETKSKVYIDGIITKIKNDSVSLLTYNIQTINTNLGVTKPDTLATAIIKLHYKDILRIKIFKKHRFIRGKIGRILMFGGAGYLALNVINGAYLDQPVTDKQNLRSLGISLGALGLGLFIHKYLPVNRFSSKRNKIVYVNVK